MKRRQMYTMAVMLLLVLLTMALGGCATIVTLGGSQKVNITSSPEGADVVIYNARNEKVVYTSTTPAVAKLKRGSGYFRKASYRIEISKDGYAKKTVPLNAGLNGGWYLAGNLIFGGFPGWLIVDPISGGMWTLKPGSVDADLVQSLSLNDDGAEGIYVVLKEQIPNAIFENLELMQLE